MIEAFSFQLVLTQLLFKLEESCIQLSVITYSTMI